MQARTRLDYVNLMIRFLMSLLTGHDEILLEMELKVEIYGQINVIYVE